MSRLAREVVSSADWMRLVDDRCSLAGLAVPGSHDTMTAGCPLEYYRTQHLDLAEQLEVGVRFLDIRLTRNMVAAHREWISTITIDEILSDIRGFLEVHPDEVIMMRVQNANEAKDDFAEYRDALHAKLRDQLELFHVFDDSDQDPEWPIVADVRGKIVTIECSPPGYGTSTVDGRRWAANWHENDHVLLQDLWDGPSPQDKEDAIEELLRRSSTAQDEGVLRLNHVSATNGELGNPQAYASVLNQRTDGMLREVEQLNVDADATVAADDPAGLKAGRGVLIYDFIDAEISARVLGMNNLG